MSFYTYIKASKPITIGNILNSIDLKNVEFDGDSDNLNEFIKNSIKFFIPFESSRGVLVTYSDDEYSVCLNIIPSFSDFKLFNSIIIAISKLTGSLVRPEEEETPIKIDDFLNTYNNNWFNQIKLLGIDMFLDKIGNQNATLAMGCCYMNVHIGPRVHSLLDKSSVENYYNSLINWISSNQFFDREQYQIPWVMRIQDKDSEETKRLVVFFPFGKQFIPSADIISMTLGDKHLDVPYDLLPQLANDKFHLIDEKQFLVDELEPNEFIEVYKKAFSIINPNEKFNLNITQQEVKSEEKSDEINNQTFEEKIDNHSVEENVKSKPWWKFW